MCPVVPARDHAALFSCGAPFAFLRGARSMASPQEVGRQPAGSCALGLGRDGAGESRTRILTEQVGDEFGQPYPSAP